MERNEYLIGMDRVQIWQGHKPIEPGTYTRVYRAKKDSPEPNAIWLKPLVGDEDKYDLSETPFFLDVSHFRREINNNNFESFDVNQKWQTTVPSSTKVPKQTEKENDDQRAQDTTPRQSSKKYISGENILKRGCTALKIENAGFRTRYNTKSVVGIIDNIQDQTYTILFYDNNGNLQRATRRKNPYQNHA